MESDSEILRVDQLDGGVIRLTMDDQNTSNSLSERMMESLIEELTKASSDDSVRVIIIASNGPVFSAGHNLKEISIAREQNDFGEEYFHLLFETCSELMKLIVACRRPVIAEVSGVATAAGCQLVASCDLATASESAKFATPGVNIGLFCSTPMVALSRNVNKKHAMKMLLTGDIIGAEKAKESGIKLNQAQHSVAGIGRALLQNQNKGIVKVYSEEDGPIVGASVCGPAAGEMIHELMYMVGWEALPSEASEFIHAHPTLSEAIGESLLSLNGRGLH